MIAYKVLISKNESAIYLLNQGNVKLVSTNFIPHDFPIRLSKSEFDVLFSDYRILKGIKGKWVKTR